MTPSLRSRGLARARLAAVTVGIALVVPIGPASVLAAGDRFLPYQAISVPSVPDAVAVGDVTGDGLDDIVATTGYSNDPASDFRLLVLAQNASGTIDPAVSYETAGTYPERPGSVAIGDITLDGRADVVVGLDRSGIQVFPQIADGTLGVPTFIATVNSTRVRIGQLDGNDTFDVVGIGWGTDTVSVFLNNGNGGLGSPVVYPAIHNGWDDLEVADVTGDQLDDIIVMSGQGFGPNLSILAQLAGGGFAGAVEYSVYQPENTSGIGVGDTDGDGRNDVVASYGGNFPSSRMALWTQLPDGTLNMPVIHNSYDIPGPVEVADLDLDGRDDVVTLHDGWNRAGVYGGRSSGTLGEEDLYEIPSGSSYSVHGLAIGDLNDDGWPDAVAADHNLGLVVLSNSTVISPTEPGAPTLTSAVPGDGSVTLTWTPPANDGGSPVGFYLASASPTGGYCFVEALSCTIAGLTNGETYSFSVRASNELGLGPDSNSLSATPGVAPSAPQSLAASPNLPTGIGLTWQPPADPGTGPISGYRIWRGVPAATPLPISTVGDVLAYTDTTAANGGFYVYRVSAINGYGEGPLSSPVNAQRGTAPSPPGGVTASVGGKGITIKWTAPFNGGSPITGFRIYRSTASGAETFLASASPGATSYVDKALAKKTRYFYWVTAVNALGESAPSFEVSASSR